MTNDEGTRQVGLHGGQAYRDQACARMLHYNCQLYLFNFNFVFVFVFFFFFLRYCSTLAAHSSLASS